MTQKRDEALKELDEARQQAQQLEAEIIALKSAASGEASKKRKKNISLTYSQVYGAVTMNNTMCLGLFMVVMRAQDLEWTFSSETLTIVLVTLLVGYLGTSRETFKSRLAVPVLALYPLSIALVCFLDFVVGWN